MLTSRTLQQIRDLILARKGIEEPGLDTSSAGDAWLDANAIAHLAMAIQADLLELAKDITPATATDDALAEHGRTWLGEAQLPATAWEGTVTFAATAGTPTIASGQGFVHADGTSYHTTATIHDYDWSAGSATTTAESITTGTVANKSDGTGCTVTSPPGGVSAACSIASTTTEAHDDETEEEFRERILTFTKYRPGGGNPADYVAWAQEVDGVYSAFVYLKWDDDAGPPANYGNVTVVPWGPPDPDANHPPYERIPSDELVAAVQAHIDAVAPVGAVVTVEKPGFTAGYVVVEVRPAKGYEPDWTGAFVVDSCVAPFTRVDLTVDPTGTINVGDRIVGYPADAPLYLAEQRYVKEVGTSYVVVTEPFSSTVKNGGGPIDPGGPLWDPVQAAVKAVYENLGTAASTASTCPRFPEVAASNPSTVFLSDLYAAVENVTGVMSSKWTTPAADVPNPIDPGDPVTVLVLGWIQIVWG